MTITSTASPGGAGVLTTSVEDASPMEAAVISAIEAMHADALCEDGIEGLAVENFYSKFHFSRQFRRITGTTPRRFLAAVRMGQAKEHLLTGDDGIAEVSNLVGGDKGLPRADKFSRPTGRGGPHDADIPEGRAYAAPPPLPEAKPWQALPLNVEQERNNPLVIPAADRPEVIVRWADANDLLISGLLEHGETMAQRAAVVQAHYGRGRVLLFANNPLWRGETIGSYALVLNALTAAAK